MNLLLIPCEGIMIAGVNIDVALIQLVEFKIVILVVMGSSPIGHPNRNPYDDMESRPSSVPWIAPRH